MLAAAKTGLHPSQHLIAPPASAFTLLHHALATTMHVSDSSALNELVGDSLQTQDAETSTSNVQGDVIGLYFSASWCGPCQRWTPQLAQFYKNFAHRPGNGGKFEVVFISADKSEADALAYYREKMPWLMLPYRERDRQAQLASMFGVRTVVAQVPPNEFAALANNGTHAVPAL